MTELTLAQRILAAADAIETLAELKHYPIPDQVGYSADELRREIRMWGTAP
jgi:hypothetical protein